MSFKVCVLSLYIVGCVRGLLLSPSGEAVVCEGGELSLTCSTNETLLSWTSSPLQNEQGQVRTFTRSISSSGVSQQVSTLMVNSTLFNVSRVSGRNESPLVSRLVINPVSVGMNGTKVNCTERAMNNENTTVASTNIDVIDELHSPNRPKITTSVMQQDIDHLTVLIEWMAEKGATYNVRSESLREIVSKNVTTSSTRITVFYNTFYNVSVEVTLCGHTNISVVEILYYEYRSKVLLGFEIEFVYGDNNHNTTASTTTNFQMCTSDKDLAPQCIGPGANGNVSEILIGTLVGLGSLCVLIVITIAVIIIMKWKVSKRKTLFVHTTNRDTRDNRQRVEGTLIYADIGPAAFKSIHASASISLDLDDSRVQYAQINCKLLEQESSKSREPHAESVAEDNSFNDDNLKVNLDNLLIQLRAQVSPLWYQFGEAAGIETEILEKLANDCSPQDCIVEMFDYWLREQKEPLTWRDVAKILKVINLEQLAAKIEEIYTTGKLSVSLISNEKLETKFEDSELPPPIPPKRLDVNHCISGRGYDQCNSCTAHEPKVFLPPPPVPLPLADSLPVLPPKTRVGIDIDVDKAVPARPPKPYM